MAEYIMYTDGSASNNKTRCGGYAFLYFKKGETTDRSWAFAEKETTNNRMEMMGVIKGIEFLLENDIKECDIYTDSAYIHNCFAQKWYINWKENGWVNSKKEPVKNKDLWIKLLDYILNPKYNFTLHKVKGHADNEFNNKVDELAVSARKKLEKDMEI